MMNKNEYISAVDKITAPEELKSRIRNDKNMNEKSSKKSYKTFAALAACLCVVVIAVVSVVSGMNLGAKSMDSINSIADESVVEHADYDVAEDYKYSSVSSTSDSASLMTRTEQNRKIIKNAELYVETKDYNKFISALDEKITAFEGYTDSFNEENYSDKTASIVIRIPSENLEKFLSGLDEIGTVQSKRISKSDVTESYIDIESHITALETEEKALLKILESCETVSETIEVQSRLSEVRAEKESYKGQIKSLDSQISYSTVNLTVSEEERIVKSDGSFSAQLKEIFSDSLYNIGNFFRNLALNFLGNILYILIIGAIAAVVIVIIVKKRKKNKI